MTENQTETQLLDLYDVQISDERGDFLHYLFAGVPEAVTEAARIDREFKEAGIEVKVSVRYCNYATGRWHEWFSFAKSDTQFKPKKDD